MIGLGNNSPNNQPIAEAWKANMKAFIPWLNSKIPIASPAQKEKHCKQCNNVLGASLWSRIDANSLERTTIKLKPTTANNNMTLEYIIKD